MFARIPVVTMCFFVLFLYHLFGARPCDSFMFSTNTTNLFGLFHSRCESFASGCTWQCLCLGKDYLLLYKWDAPFSQSSWDMCTSSCYSAAGINGVPFWGELHLWELSGAGRMLWLTLVLPGKRFHVAIVVYHFVQIHSAQVAEPWNIFLDVSRRRKALRRHSQVNAIEPVCDRL